MDCGKVHRVYGDFIKKELSLDEMSWIESHFQDFPDSCL